MQSLHFISVLCYIFVLYLFLTVQSEAPPQHQNGDRWILWDTRLPLGSEVMLLQHQWASLALHLCLMVHKAETTSVVSLPPLWA